MAGESEANAATFEVWPHRSLSRRGAAIVLAVLALGLTIVVLRCPTPAIMPIACGAVLAFAILATAFWASFRSARRVERIVIGPRTTCIERHQAGRPATVTEFTTYWLRVDLTTDREAEHRLTLVEGRKRLSIAEFLSPGEREKLASALRGALAEARGRTAAETVPNAAQQPNAHAPAAPPTLARRR